MSKKQKISQTQELIDLFGSNAKMARALDVKPHTICGFKTRGIPMHYHLPFWVALKEMGYEVDAAKLFGEAAEKSRLKIVNALKTGKKQGEKK